MYNVWSLRADRIRLDNVYRLGQYTSLLKTRAFLEDAFDNSTPAPDACRHRTLGPLI